MDRTLIRPSRAHLNKKAEALLGHLQPWSRGSLARQRETHWVLNSLHLHSEGHLQRLKQLNIPPSGALTLTSQGTKAPYISNLQLQIRLFFFTPSYRRSITPSPLKKHLSDSGKDTQGMHILMLLRQKLCPLQASGCWKSISSSTDLWKIEDKKNSLGIYSILHTFGF